MLGYKAHELVGRHTPTRFHLAEEVQAYALQLSAEFSEDIPAGFRVFHTRVDQLGKDEREWTYVRKDGSEFPVLLSVTALRDDTQEVTGFLFIA
mgnify:CR=1 FL=1